MVEVLQLPSRTSTTRNIFLKATPLIHRTQTAITHLYYPTRPWKTKNRGSRSSSGNCRADYYPQMSVQSGSSKEQVNCKDVDKNAAAHDKRDRGRKKSRDCNGHIQCHIKHRSWYCEKLVRLERNRRWEKGIQKRGRSPILWKAIPLLGSLQFIKSTWKTARSVDVLNKNNSI